MVKDLMKRQFSLIDPSNKEEVEAALVALNTVEEVPTEKVELDETTPTEVKLGEATLDDGTRIFFPGDNLSEGSVVYTDDTQETIHPAGDVTIDNGDVVRIGDEGIVTEIVTPDGDTEEEIDNTDEELQTPETVEEVLTALQPVFDDIYAQIEALRTGNDELSKVNETLKADILASNEKLEKLGKSSAAEPFTAEKEVQKSAFLKNQSGYQRALQSGDYSPQLKNK